MLKEKIGIVLIALGISTANSEMLILPLASMGIGVWLIRSVVEW